MGEALSVEAVTFGYGGAPVLRDLTLRVPAGRFTAVLGANGSGKSTLLALLAGLAHPQRGAVRLQGRPLGSLSPRERARRLALVPQDFFIHFPFTVREVVSMGRHAHLGRFATPTARDHEAVDRALEELGLTALADAAVTNLSGGERQRVVVARALAQEASVVLLDEATSNLDIHHALDLLALVQRRVGDGTLTAIAVMHDLNLAAAHADRLILLKRGAVIAEGTTPDVLTPEVIEDAFGVRARVLRDEPDGVLRVAVSRREDGTRGDR